MPAAEIATIGDQPNDVLMFKRSGFSIAMGNASDQVKAQARPSRIPTTTKASPRRWSASFLARRPEAMSCKDDRTHRGTSGSAGAGAPCCRMDDGDGLGGEGPFRVSLSGGSTPKTLYELLASDEFKARFPWQQVIWYWGDERFVPYDHPESNFRMAHKAMLAKAPVPPENIHPVPVDGSPEEAALTLRAHLAGGLWRYDAGPGNAAVRHHLAGDRAGWPYRFAAAGRHRFAGADALGCRRLPRPARGSHHHDLSGDREQPACRLSGGGQEKAAIFSTIRAGDSEVPAARVQPVGDSIWFVDQAAAGEDNASSLAQTQTP